MSFFRAAGRKFGASVRFWSSINHKSTDARQKRAKTKKIVIRSQCELLTMTLIRITAVEVHLSQTKNC